MTHAHLDRTPEMAASINRPPDARTLTVVAVEFRRGEGCCEADPVRMVTAYYSLDGVLLAERDTLSLTQEVPA